MVLQNFDWMLRLKKWISKLIDTGVDQVSPLDVKVLRTLNAFALVMSLVSTSYIFVFYYFNFMPLVYGAIILVPSYLLTLWITKFGRISLGTFWLLSCINVAIFYFAHVSGPENYIHLGYFLTLAVAYLLVPSPKLKVANILAIMSGVLLVSYLALHWQGEGLNELILPILVSSTVMLLQGFCLSHLCHQNYKHAEDLHLEINHKQNLLNMLSHDINTPLTVASAHLQFLKKNGKRDSKEAMHLEKISRAVVAIDSLIQNVRTLQALNQNKLVLKKSIVLMADLEAEIFDLFSDRIKKKIFNFMLIS